MESGWIYEGLERGVKWGGGTGLVAREEVKGRGREMGGVIKGVGWVGEGGGGGKSCGIRAEVNTNVV